MLYSTSAEINNETVKKYSTVAYCAAAKALLQSSVF